MKNGSAFGLVALTATAAVLLGTAPSHATAINDLFVFGDSYSDTGAYFPLTNGSTAVGYLAQDLGITLTTSKNPNPGTDGVNFAQSGAKIAIGPTPPATQPLSLTQQVAQFQAYVEAGTVSFNPASSVFMLLGGLNDHTTSQSLIASATTSQVATLYSLGARLFDIALIPADIPLFEDSAVNVNPVIRSLIPQLQAEFPGAVINLSNWGPDYDQIISNPGPYGLTNTTAPCFDFATFTQTCTTPSTYFYYYIGHPSAAVHQIVGNELVAEVEAIPEPLSLALLGTGVAATLLTSRKKSRPTS